MTLTSIVPLAAALLAATFFARIASSGARSKNAWLFPAVASVLFFAWSAFAAVSEGPTGFWPEHTRNLWGNQIWMDLLLAASVGYFALAPRARALGMNLWVWGAVVLATGSIGLTAMVSRLVYLEERRPTR